jgi:gliding motility-associated-like protein
MDSKSLIIALVIIFSFFYYNKLNAQINFREVTTYLGANIETVDIGDVNNDCLNDVVAGSTGQSDNLNPVFNIYIFIQNAQGTLNPPIPISYSPRGFIYTVKIADVNNDFLNDIIVAYRDSVKIYYQDSTLQFMHIDNFYSGTSIDGLDIGDLNNDGLTDIAVSHKQESYIKVFYQNNNKAFTVKTYNKISNSFPNQLLVKDINNDGLDDILKIDHLYILVLYQSCSIKGIDSTIYITEYANYNDFPALNGIDVGYLGNSEGKNSLLIGLGGNQTVCVIGDQNKDGKLNSFATATIGGFDGPAQIKIADLNNDGINELVIGQEASSTLIYERQSDGNYINIKVLRASEVLNPTNMAVGDINNDGLVDVVKGWDNLILFHYNSSKNEGVASNNSRNHFYPCQTLTNDSITNHSISLRTVTGVEKNCNYIQTFEKEIVTKYLIQKGIGDSVIFTNNCYKTRDTIKRNQLIHKKIIQSRDTIAETLIDTKYTFQSFLSSISGPNTICASASPVNYQSINNLTTTNTWYYSNDSLTSQIAQFVLSIPGSQILSVKEAIQMSLGSCINYDTLNIQVIPNLLVQNTILGKDTVCGEEVNIVYTIPKNVTSVYTWSVSGGSFTQQGTNSILINFPAEGEDLISVVEKDKNGCIGPVSLIEVTIKKIADCLSVPNVFTPNEDGVNDVFEIKNLSLYPNNRLSVYNRWGNKVFQAENYIGMWKAENISDGIYYYSLEINYKLREKGWVQILR